MNSRPPGTLLPTAWHKQISVMGKALPALLALGVLTGCGGGGGSATTAPVTTQPTPVPVSPAPAGQSVSAPALSSFTATLSEDQSSVSVGGTVSYTLTLANTSAAPATVVAETSSGVNVPIAALRIIDPSGLIVYPPVSHPGVRPLDTPPPPPGSGVVTLQPGQSLSVTRALSVFSKPGNYQAVATFTMAATATDASQTVTLNALPLAVK